MKKFMSKLFNSEEENLENEISSKIQELEKEVIHLYEQSKPFDFKKHHQYINHNKLMKTTSFNEETINSANDILNNNLVLLGSLDVISFEDKIDWNYNHTNSSNTYKLYMQCLNFVSTLLDAYINTKERVYLLKAYEILLDWIIYIKSDKTKNKFKWVDHTVSNRVMNITYFLSVVEDDDDFEIVWDIFGKLLIEHGRFLEDDNNYRPNNHGIMMDRAIILLAVFMKPYPSSERWYQKGKLRLLNALYRDFSHQGVHLENSPFYHIMTRRIFKELQQFLKDQEIKLGKEFNERIEAIDEYINYILKPDLTLPIIGDTQTSKLDKFTKNYSTFIDTHAGIALLQKKNDVSPENSTWVSFICGYGSDTHKHNDDLSINIYHNGDDILQDSGRYNYDRKDEIRQYILSPNAHSTLTVKGKSYEIKSPYENNRNIKITDHLSNKTYDLIRGIHWAYENVQLARTVIYLKQYDLIIICDEIESGEEVTTQQIFNLDNEVQIEDAKINHSILKTKKNNVSISQHNLNNDIVIHKLDSQMDPPQALISKTFGKLAETNQLIYEKTGTKMTYLTSISLNQNSNQIEQLDFDYEKKLMTLIINSEPIYFKL